MAANGTWARRSFLKTFAGIGGAASFAGLFKDLWAAGTPASNLRFCVLNSPHGYAPMYWRPRAADGVSAPSETGWTLDFTNSSLAPLEKHKDSLVLLEGLDLSSDFTNPDFFTGGHNGVSTLTGMHPIAGENDTVKNYWGCGPSIDYYIANLLNTPPFLFTPTGYGGAANTISAFRTDGSPITAEYSLKNSLVNWFGSVGSGSDPKAAARKNAQQAVVSYLNGEATRLRTRLAGTEKAKLDAHLDSLNSISQRINTVTSVSCAKPTQAPDGDDVKPTGDKYIPMILDFMAELFACNLTRVMHVPIDPINSGTAPWLASKDPIFQTAIIHDNIAHGYRPNDESSQRLLSIVSNWYASQVSYFIDLLKAIPEGNGSVYDNTIILWVNELGDPARHMHTNIPLLLAGGGGSYAKGRYLAYGLGLENADSNDPHTRLLTSLANQFGANLNVFGDPRYTGELPRL